jgi:hypothetical protein
MIAIGRRGWREIVMLGLLLACETARTPSSDAVPPASDERSGSGASASMPAGGGAAAELNGGVGGNAPRPSGSGASGVGGNDTGSGGTAADGAGGGSSGASGRDADPSSDDELRYALWLGPTVNASAARDGVQPPHE